MEKYRGISGFPAKRIILISILAVLLELANMNACVHRFIVNVDVLMAYKLNSIIGMSHFVDSLSAWLSTRLGDLLLITVLYGLFLTHALRAHNSEEMIKRMSFWLWLGILCLGTYLISCLSENFIKRETPLLALSHFKNLQSIYGLPLHSCPTSSFPSGHGFAYIFFSMMAWRPYRKISLVLWCSAIIMLTIRLMLGLHWFTDIFFGSTLLAVFLISVIKDTSLKYSYVFVKHHLAFLMKQYMFRFYKAST